MITRKDLVIISNKIFELNPDWKGGASLGLPYPRPDSIAFFLECLFGEMKARGASRDEVQYPTVIGFVEEICTPKYAKGKENKQVLRLKEKELENLTIVVLEAVFPEEELRFNTSDLKLKDHYKSNKAPQAKIVVLEPWKDPNNSAEERMRLLYEHLDARSGEGKPIVNITADKGLVEIAKESPHLLKIKENKYE